MSHLRLIALNAMKLRWVSLAGLLLIVSAVSVHYIRTRSKTRATGTIAQAVSPPTLRKRLHIDVKYDIRTKGDSQYPEGDLLADVNGKTQVVMSEVGLNIVDVGDFDGNGTSDALISIFGGGTCCPTSYSIVSATEDGRFVVIRNFASSWGQDATTESWHGRWSVVIGDVDDAKRRFVLENGKPIAVEEDWGLRALAEMTIGTLNFEDDDDTHELEFDLDGDGKNDVITGRWFNYERPRRAISWDVSFADGKRFNSHLGCERVGVLETKTNGVHDLVCNLDLVIKWDGHTYIEPD